MTRRNPHTERLTTLNTAIARCQAWLTVVEGIDEEEYRKNSTFDKPPHHMANPTTLREEIARLEQKKAQAEARETSFNERHNGDE